MTNNNKYRLSRNFKNINYKKIKYIFQNHSHFHYDQIYQHM
jgi:hypothetical protein